MMTKATSLSVCDLPLGSCPRLVNCGLAEHGLQGTEHYQLPKLWCLHLYFYKVQVEVGGQPFEILPSSITLIPPGARIVYHYKERRHRHFFVHFATEGRRAPVVSVPICQHLPEAMNELLDRMENIQRIQRSNPHHAGIGFWSLLWDIAESGKGATPNHERDIARIVDERIDAGLWDLLSVAQIARELNLTATHINRLVKARHGITTIQLIRKRRLQRAHHLLLQSTMPIKLVAAECGVRDMQKFNKIIRLEYGISPTAIRTLHSDNRAWQAGRK